MDINDSTGGAPLDFEGFVKELTHRLVRVILLRETPSARKEDARTSDSWMLLTKTIFHSMTWNTLVINSVTDMMMNKSGKSSTLLEDTEPRVSPSRNTTSSSRRNSTKENWVSDHLSLFNYFIFPYRLKYWHFKKYAVFISFQHLFLMFFHHLRVYTSNFILQLSWITKFNKLSLFHNHYFIWIL